MRRAIAGEFAALPGGDVRVVMTLDARLPASPGPWASSDRPGRARPQASRALPERPILPCWSPPRRAGILARLTRDLEQAGARFSARRPRPSSSTGDKARLAAHLRIMGIDTPPTPTIVPREGLPEARNTRPSSSR